MKNILIVMALAALGAAPWLPAAASSAAAAGPDESAELEAGFRLLYNLQFEAAEKSFHEYQQRHSSDPLGFAAEAAGLAFREFYRLGLLRSTNFLGLHGLDGAAPRPDPLLRRRFLAVQARTKSLAGQRLAKDPRDQDACFALALTSGLGADYSYLVERRGWEALKHTREADREAKRLLALNSSYYDAYLPVGAANYILGSLPASQRLLLRLAGVSGDKQRGMKLLELVAQRGDLLKPYAKILLALAYLRENEPTRARQLLVELKQQFPSNSIFPRELARLDGEKSGGRRQ